MFAVSELGVCENKMLRTVSRCEVNYLGVSINS
jgi:hypothetical protein